jgi:glycerol-3-phosphate acyltransferase PlsX
MVVPQAPSIFSAIRMAKEAVDNQVLVRLQSQYQILQNESS